MAACTIAIVVKRFPKLSETFIAGEISELIRQGINLRIFSIERPGDEIIQSASLPLLQYLTYLDEVTEAQLSQQQELLACDPAVSGRRLPMPTGSGAEATPDQVLRLVVLIRRFGIGHLHTHYLSGPALLSELACQLASITYSVSAHAKDIYLTAADQARTRLQHATFAATCTKANEQYLKQLSPAEQHKIHLIYHGIDTDYFSPCACASHRGAIGTRPLLLGIGRFKRKKGFDLLVQACALLRDGGHEFDCRIVGYGDQRQALTRQISDHQLQELVRLGDPVDGETVRQLLRQASIFVLPCRISEDGDRDGIPNAILEAMACEVPVVSTPVSGIPEVVESPRNGILVAPDDAAGLARALADLLADTGRARLIGRQARRTVQARFNWSSNVQPLAQRLLSVSGCIATGGSSQ